MAMLVAYDGRENTEKALDYAIGNSLAYRDRLIVLAVVPKGSEGDVERVHEYTARALERARSRGADVQSIVESGQPDKVILETANRFGCDTIIVGRSSKTTLDRVIMGSVSNSIVANASCTVIVVQ
ncbi:universal stress protein [Candidatus Methanoprimaticola sp. MG2]|uniref:universal stress protein n=1 Tax=Candidatus Methanoprimaticola sp. MG2 TaxID=3228838 RepID=UPI0039C5DA89